MIEISEVEKHEIMLEIEQLAEMEGLRQFAKLGTELSISSEMALKIDNKADQQTVDASVMELQGAIDSIESDVEILQSDLSTLDGVVLKEDGSVALTADWDIGDGRMIQANKIRARDGDGLALYEDGGSGIFVKDGGNVGIGTTVPSAKLAINGGLAVGEDADPGDNNLKVVGDVTVGGNIGLFNNTSVSQRLKADYNDWATLADVVQALVDFHVFDQV